MKKRGDRKAGKRFATFCENSNVLYSGQERLLALFHTVVSQALQHFGTRFHPTEQLV